MDAGCHAWSRSRYTSTCPVPPLTRRPHARAAQGRPHLRSAPLVAVREFAPPLVVRRCHVRAERVVEEARQACRAARVQAPLGSVQLQTPRPHPRHVPPATPPPPPPPQNHGGAGQRAQKKRTGRGVRWCRLRSPVASIPSPGPSAPAFSHIKSSVRCRHQRLQEGNLSGILRPALLDSLLFGHVKERLCIWVFHRESKNLSTIPAVRIYLGWIRLLGNQILTPMDGQSLVKRRDAAIVHVCPRNLPPESILKLSNYRCVRYLLNHLPLSPF